VLAKHWILVILARIMDSIESLGIIAGNRSLPLMFAEQARKMGVKRLVAAAFEGETEATLAPLVDEIVWLKVGQLSKLICVFTDRGIKQCVMVGQIAPKNLYDVRPDLRAMALLLRLKEKNAHTIFGGIADELKKDGIELIDALPWLQPLMAANGFGLGPKERRRFRVQNCEGSFTTGYRPDGGGEGRDGAGGGGIRGHGQMPGTGR
jgi:UDP-2,3-diacylglucosamine hydrolase